MSVTFDIIQEILALTLVLAIVRWAQTHIGSDTTTGKAIAWIYH